MNRSEMWVYIPLIVAIMVDSFVAVTTIYHHYQVRIRIGNMETSSDWFNFTITFLETPKQGYNISSIFVDNAHWQVTRTFFTQDMLTLAATTDKIVNDSPKLSINPDTGTEIAGEVLDGREYQLW